jgi:FdhD protein
MRHKKTPIKKNPGITDGTSYPSEVRQGLPCAHVDGDLVKQGIREVAEELPVALFINGHHATTAMACPVNLEDFVTGYLFTEEIIRTLKEIESIRIEKNRVSIITKNLFKVLPPKKTILSGCGGSTSYIDPEKLPRIHSDFSIGAAEISAALKSCEISDIRQTAIGLTTAVLHDSRQAIGTAEDLSGQNAVDRIIGSAVRNGIYLSQTFLIVSGLISSEIVRKCLTANIPILVSRGSITALAAELADTTGMTVIGFARDGRLDIFSHPERIVTGTG